MKIKGNITVIALVFLTILASLGLFVFRDNLKDINIPKITSSNLSAIIPTQTPIPFQEMTIPYLSKREYKSNLGELKKYSDNGSYTTYITSYDSDGFKINGLLTIPKEKSETGKYPAIVFVHGYIAPTIYKTTEKYVDYVNYLARNGYVVFKIDLRGHGTSEGDASGAYYSGDYVVDTLNAYSALQNSDFVDPNKIGLWGHSMAGNVVSRSFAAKPDIPAVVVWSGAGYTYTDLLEYRISDRSYRPPQENTERLRKRQELRDTYGEFDPNSDFWKQVAITNYLKDLKGAIAIFHAEDDDVVSVEYSRNLDKLLNENEITHEYHEYPTGGHNITGSSFTKAFASTIDFFNRHLKN